MAEVRKDKRGHVITEAALAAMRANGEKARAAFKAKYERGEVHWPKRQGEKHKNAEQNVTLEIPLEAIPVAETPERTKRLYNKKPKEEVAGTDAEFVAFMVSAWKKYKGVK